MKNRGVKNMKKCYLKKWVSMVLVSINIMLILLIVMLMAELNECWLFYSVSINIITLNTHIIHKYASPKFNHEYMYIFRERKDL